NKLKLLPSGATINADPGIEDITIWEGATALHHEPGTGVGWIGAKAFNSAVSASTFSELIPIDTQKTYRISMRARSSGGGDRRIYGCAIFYDEDKVSISGASSPASWPGAGTYHYYGLINL